jgi:phospholipid/cholesterol/gamma-HCH transport system ATP-binding protein
VTDSALIRVSGLTMGWDPVVLQKDASFEIARGDIFVIVGGSGCGKSTLLRHLIGLETPLSGTIEIDGVKNAPLSVGHPRFGVTFQSGALLGSMTVGDNLALALSKWTDLPCARSCGWSGSRRRRTSSRPSCRGA